MFIRRPCWSACSSASRRKARVAVNVSIHAGNWSPVCPRLSRISAGRGLSMWVGWSLHGTPRLCSTWTLSRCWSATLSISFLWSLKMILFLYVLALFVDILTHLWNMFWPWNLSAVVPVLPLKNKHTLYNIKVSLVRNQHLSGGAVLQSLCEVLLRFSVTTKEGSLRVSVCLFLFPHDKHEGNFFFFFLTAKMWHIFQQSKWR